MELKDHLTELALGTRQPVRTGEGVWDEITRHFDVSDKQLHDAFKTWEHYSGNPRYPVP